ncbi:hypothetical protein LIER_16915 [Lithospermum erythrorhizon]|uniref:Uncharacterized protein n=1 Tax=Lithospermum erythrorhizon TaxID=34254 RepID=A0AAV3QAV9_LITER
MASITSKKQQYAATPLGAEENNIEFLLDEEANENNNKSLKVTSHLYLKPAHTTATLDKETVLRRIRQRKRANKAKGFFQRLISYTFATKNEKGSSSQIRWVDNAFAAP